MSSEVGLDLTSTFFSFNDPPTTVIYTLSLHDALPIFTCVARGAHAIIDVVGEGVAAGETGVGNVGEDRKSTRLNSSHLGISYAVFCLKQKHRAAQLTVRLAAPAPARSRSAVSEQVAEA